MTSLEKTIQNSPLPHVRGGLGVSERRLPVAVVDEELPYPANSGKRIRTLNLLLPLAQRHRITYFAHPSAVGEETDQAVAWLRARGIEPLLVDHRLPSKAGMAPWTGCWRIFSHRCPTRCRSTIAGHCAARWVNMQAGMRWTCGTANGRPMPTAFATGLRVPG